jgi:hypothetical protein
MTPDVVLFLNIQQALDLLLLITGALVGIGGFLLVQRYRHISNALKE